MPTRKVSIAEGEYYHILARGVNKQQIFFDERDYIRFLFYIMYFQSPITIRHIDRRVTEFLDDGDFGIPPQKISKIIEDRSVELVSFCLMPNHIHLIIGEIQEGGISKMMQRMLDGYTRYYHIKYKKSGYVFGGPFKAVRVKNNRQLLYLSTYIHKNPKEIKGLRQGWDKYPWSSYRDYVSENSWDGLLARDIILGQFKNSEEYSQFTKESIAKEILDDYLLIDP